MHHINHIHAMPHSYYHPSTSWALADYLTFAIWVLTRSIHVIASTLFIITYSLFICTFWCLWHALKWTTFIAIAAITGAALGIALYDLSELLNGRL